MSSFRLTIEDGQFRDGQGRQVMLRGINVAGDCKLPSNPSVPSHVKDQFFDGDNVDFHERPFTKNDAHVHFARIKRYGFNTIRYVFMWEAIEAAGPGKYDEDFIQHTIEVLRIAKGYGFYVFMDPHQDVWSRFTGGSGAPMWTVYACGLNPKTFAATEAAIVQNTYPDPDKFPKMIWSTNYFRLAAATIFCLFFAGRDFAPKCIIDGMNIQDYLQSHFVGACAHLGKRIKEAGDLHGEVVMGWESMNEPNRGLTGYEDLTTIPKEQQLKKGTSPTMWQAILTGMGRACEVDVWEMGGLGPYKTGTTLVDPHGEIAWVPADYDDTKYGWKRDPGWKLGECIWAQHGVWDPSTDTLLNKSYFAKDPKGEQIDYPRFTNTYFMDFWRRYSEACREHQPGAIMLMQYPTLELPPEIKGTADDDPMIAFTPHFYDGITLMTKHWNSTWNVDVVGVLRGKYLHPAFAIRIGESAIRNCLREQLKTLRQEGIDRAGNHPCILSEFGIPYDMDDKKAYKTGDYSSQSSALDANYFAVEGANLEGHCLWLYTAYNDHDRGDQWNGEDLSINCVDDALPPSSPLPRTLTNDPSSSSISKTAGQDGNNVAEATNLITPGNLQRTLTTPSISSARSLKDPELTNSPGLRAAEAFIRPTPVVISGNLESYGFDMKKCVFEMKVNSSIGAPVDAPTIIFLPDYHYPKDQCEISVSSGKWEISSDESEGTLLQRLRWWHEKGEQTIKITGLVRKHNAPEGTEEEAGYLEQCQKSCSVM